MWVANIPTRAVEKAMRTKMWEQWSGSGRIHDTAAGCGGRVRGSSN